MPTQRPRRRRRDSGAALILTLLVLAILVVLVVQFVFSMKVEEQIVQNTGDDTQLELAVRGSGSVLGALFRDDRKNGEPKEDVDTLADILFDPKSEDQRTVKLGEVELTFVAEDLERRLPLLWLADEERKEFTQKALERLIAEVAPEAGDAAGLAEEIAGIVQGLQGGGAGGTGQPAPASPAPGTGSSGGMTRGLYSIEQLLGGGAAAPPAGGTPPATPPPAGGSAPAGGVTHELLFGDAEKDPPSTGIAPYLTTWPISAINLNTVLPEVLLAIWPEEDQEEQDPPGKAKFWENENQLAKEMIDTIGEKGIDPDYQSGGGTGQPGDGGAGTGGGAGASRQWSGEAFTDITKLKDVDEKLKKIFPESGETGGGTGGETAESSFGFQQALTVKSRFYAVRVTTSVGEIEAVYRLVVYRSEEDEVSVLLLEAVPE